MSLLNSHAGYGRIPKILHWLMMVLLVMMLAGEISGQVHEDQVSHEILGKVILSLAAARLIVRLLAPRPAPLPSHAKWEIGLSHFVHWGLYLILFLYPISGWMMVSAGDWGETGNLGFIPDAWEGALYTWHVAMKWVLAGFVTLHIAGAEKHAIRDRDGTLRRMWFVRA